MALALAVLLLPHTIRLENFGNYVPGEEPYCHMAMAGDSTGNLYHVILGAVSQRIGIFTAANFLPFAIGSACVILFYFLLKHYTANIYHRLLAALLWIVSPIFVYSFSVPEPGSLLLLIGLAGLLLLNTYAWLSIAVLPLAGLFDPISAALVCIVILPFKNKKIVTANIALTAAVLLMSGNFHIPGFEVPGVAEAVSSNISGFGTLSGFNAFALILSMIGMIKSWKNSRRQFFALLFIGVGSLLFPSQKVLLNAFLAYYGGIGLVVMYNRNWELNLIRNATIILLVFALSYSTVANIYSMSSMEPSLERIAGLSLLKDITEPGDVILSHPQNSCWIRFFGERKPLLSPGRVPENALELLRTRNEETAVARFREYNTSHIFLDSRTRELMYQDNVLGLGFVMENSAHFRQESVHRGFEIWAFLSRGPSTP